MPLVAAAGLVGLFLAGTNTKFRLAAIVVGGVAVFQSSEGLDAPKLLYLALPALCLALAVGEPSNRVKRVSAIAAATLTLLTIAALLSGRDPILVVRDASNYLFLTAAAPLAVQHGLRLEPRYVERMIAAVGAIGVYALTAEWIDNRDLGHLPSPGVPSTTLFTIAVAYAASRAVTAHRSSWRWWSLVALYVVAGLATGTRNILLTIVAPLVIVVWSTNRPIDRAVRQRARRAAIAAIPSVPLVAAVVVLVLSRTSIDLGAAYERVRSVFDIGNDAVASQSLELRRLQGGIAWDAFLHQPIVGGGPGRLWQWRASYMETSQTSLTMDTPALVLAKWGIVGTGVLAWLLVSWWRFLRPRRTGASVFSLTALGMAPVLLLQGALASLPEDRGLPLVLILLGAGVVAASRAPVSRTGPGSDDVTSNVVSREPR